MTVMPEGEETIEVCTCCGRQMTHGYGIVADGAGLRTSR
jgi:hypothetical protein